MKEIVYQICTPTGRMRQISSSYDVKISEYENIATDLVFTFDRPIKDTDVLIIEFRNRVVAKPYRLERVNATRYKTSIPREVLLRGRLEFCVHHYDKEMYKLQKFEPETPLYVTAGMDITNDVMETRPDLFAELFYRLEKLEKTVESLKKTTMGE